MEPNPAEHIPLIYHVINQMGLSEWERDEAFSEGLVALVTGSRSFNPERGDLAPWLARNIRWGIQNWQRKQMYNWMNQIPPAMETSRDDIEHRVRFNDLVRLMERELTKDEQVILFAQAAGYEGKEIAKFLGVSEMTVVRRRRKAQAKLQPFLE